MTKLWAVWETEYPDNGCVGVEASSAGDAKLAYERAGFKDGTAALSVQPLTLASEIEGKALTVEELAGVLKAGHRAIIREADEWRPLANHVLGLIALARKDRPCPDCTEGPMVQWCAACGHGMAPPSDELRMALSKAADALVAMKHRDVDGHPCWCLLWPDEEPHCEAKQEKDPAVHCLQAQAALAALTALKVWRAP